MSVVCQTLFIEVQVANSLNDGISNEGIFRSNEVTDQQKYTI